ncbi:MAG TPA: hypothetical protein VJB10_03655 [Candidatus Peribacteraceae bacterium]|nr:hypothetical protein [Candidatus Peribacteraceae bacterium]
MPHTCTDCSARYEIPKDEQAFHADMGVTPPKQCPHCRFVRRLNERNARNLYRRKCDLTGKEFISPYSDVPFPVYHPDVWFSDDWDDLKYGRDIDWNRPFFDQLLELFHCVPHQGQFICPGTLENSEYVNCAGYLKDCYLVAETDYNEKCLYGNRVFHNISVVDCSNIYESELCYECIDCTKCHSCRYCIDCLNCSDCFAMRNCIGCRDCIGCMNLRQKQYMLFNEQLSKEEYAKKKKEMALHTTGGVESLRRKAKEFFLTQPHRFVQMEQVQNCSGDHLFNSKNAHDCVDCTDLEDCKYCARVFKAKSAMDYTSWGDKSERIYQCGACGDNAYNLKFCTTCATNNSDLEYCGHCTGCKNCFGCVGMRKKQHCILNKQYFKKEYEDTRKKLIKHMEKHGEWGEYFPKQFCPFGYNETLAAEYFPLTKKEALAKGYRWKDPVDEKPNVAKVIPAKKLPPSIEDIPDDILHWAVTCEETGRPFRIIKQELDFYRQMQIPVPHFHPDERHRRRMELRPSRVFYDRTCDKCGKEIQTTYAPERPEIVYCEECYLSEVY